MKEYRIQPIDMSHIEEIIGWTYDEPYSIYNLENNPDTIENFLNNNYCVLLNHKNELIGYYCYGEEATIPYGSIYSVYQDEGYIDVGLGMNPKLVSQGFGKEFFMLGLDYLSELHQNSKFRLTVLESNFRGRKLYSRLGFKVKYVFPSNVGTNKFLVMMKD